MVTPTGKWVKFVFYRPNAKSVEIIGDFTGHDGSRLRMVRTGAGYWVAALRLPPGTYTFRYLADGQWYCDYAAFGIEYGADGLRSVIRVDQHHSPSGEGPARKEYAEVTP